VVKLDLPSIRFGLELLEYPVEIDPTPLGSLPVHQVANIVAPTFLLLLETKLCKPLFKPRAFALGRQIRCVPAGACHLVAVTGLLQVAVDAVAERMVFHPLEFAHSH